MCMSDFFQELNLPFPINDEVKEKILEIKRKSEYRPYLFLTRDPEKFLNEQIIKIFSDINLWPDTLIVFGHVDNVDYGSPKPVIHSDIIYTDSVWKKVPFAINWDSEEINPTLKWWDTSGLREIYPSDFSNNDIFKYGNAIHYGNRMNRDISKMKCLEKYIIKKSKAVMIRTEVPHSVSYKSGFSSRSSVSLRFPLDKISSWKSALEIFRSFY